MRAQCSDPVGPQLPLLGGAWESDGSFDGRRVKIRIVGPNVEREREREGLNRRNKRGSRQEKRLNMLTTQLTKGLLTFPSHQRKVKKELNPPMPLSFSSVFSNSVARLSKRKPVFLSGVAKT